MSTTPTACCLCMSKLEAWLTLSLLYLPDVFDTVTEVNHQTRNLVVSSLFSLLHILV